MNTNRTKYAWTPTYGMNKKSLFKKASQPSAPQAPDFTKAPDATASLASQPAIPMQPSAFGQSAFGQQAAAPASPYFAPNASQVMPQPAAQVPFAAPSFIQPGAPRTATPMPPPLANSAPNMNPMGTYSPRAQGFVPTVERQPAAPVVQSAPFQSSAQPFQPAQPPFQATQQQPFAQPSAYAPLNAAYVNTQKPPVQAETPAAPPQQPKAAAPSPVSVDKLWSAFLFVLLPLLLIPCLFLDTTVNVVRYVFLGLTVCALGGMWYRQMYTPGSRLIISVVFVALCVAVFAMTMQGSRDVQQTGSPSLDQSSQSSPQSVNEAVMPDVSASVSPTPSPTPAGPSVAQQRLELFMNLWKVNNTAEMVSLVQPSWRSAQSDASVALFTVLANRTPEDFTIEEITGTDADNSRTVTMTATINKNTGKDPSKYRFMVLMVKEGGEWYVDPNSLSSNESVQDEEENVVNNNFVGLDEMTPPPRTTVSPAPPASTVLYYNPDGGSYYHLDPYCSSVREEYLPLQGTFSYSELESYQGRLQPCLSCGAPITPLSSEE